jgi:hypothetical protein
LTDTLYFIFFLVLIAQELINVATYPGVVVIRVVRVPMVVILAPYLVQIFESNDVAVLGEIEAK